MKAVGAAALQVSVQDALDRAYRYLGQRDRSVAEIRSHLEAKEFPQASIDGAVEELLEQGYLDDARFARRFSEDRRNLDGWGSERIERRLRALGIDGPLIATAVGAGADTELAAAVQLLQRRYREPFTDGRARQKALGVLVRKGYELELAYDALRAFEDGTLQE